MPRQSAASRAFSTDSTTGTRPLLSPPSALNDLERAEFVALILGSGRRSEERRVGKECRSRWSPYH